MHPSLIITSVLAGCGSNAVFLELLTRDDPGSGNIVTFGQFLFISLVGFILTAKLGTKRRIIPFQHYIKLVILFLVANLTNNYAFNFDISMPLHMIFRSGSLISSMFLGVFLLKRNYTVGKYSSVIMITVGIIICTLVSQKPKAQNEARVNDESNGNYFSMLIGISLLSVALLVSSGLGIYQETLFVKYGKHTAEEALFYSHLIPLPGFLLMAHNLYYHSVLFMASESITIPGLSITAPRLWLYLLGNVTTQYICIRSVYTLTSECTSLTVTLVVTLRKFLSLLFSIFYFQNPFTAYHWLGTFLVFVGTLMFIDIISIVRSLAKTSEPSKKVSKKKRQ